MVRRSVFGLAFVTIAFCMVADASAQVAKRFGGFSVVCDDSLHCAATVQAVNPDKASVFVLSRAPESRARWTASISTLGVLADRDRPVALSVDNGVDITLRPVSDYAPFVNPSDYYIVSPTALDRLMLQVQRGHMLRFSFIDIAGAPHSDRFPLDGLAPALNEIDRQQGRIPGDRRAGPPIGLPEAPDVDVAAHLVAAGVPPRLLELHLASAVCETPDAADIANVKPLIGALSDTATPPKAAAPKRDAATPVAVPKPVKLSWKEERELEALPDRIAALEDEQTAAQARLNDPSIYRDAPQDVPVLNSRLQALEAEIEAAMLRWEDLESRSGKK